MKKKIILRILLDSIFLIAFNAVFFVVFGTEHFASVWISYGFLHFSYLVMIALPLLVREPGVMTFNLSISSISSTYFTIELILFAVFLWRKSETYKPALVIQIVLLGVYMAAVLYHLLANERTSNRVQQKRETLLNFKTAAARVKSAMENVENQQLYKAIEKAYDALLSSPIKSTLTTHPLENEIENTIAYLEQAVSSGDQERAYSLAMQIVSLVKKRNEIIKTVK